MRVNHKRGRSKNARAGCLLCKPHKANGAALADREPVFARRRRYSQSEIDEDLLTREESLHAPQYPLHHGG